MHSIFLPNRFSGLLQKLPRSVQGQPFNIKNCHNCTIQIPDYCDQVQIDDCTNCKIFIGASSESIFVRDCKDCVLTVACKQLRTRDCTGCTFYLYCKTEPIIESSTAMRFACFNGAYPGHEDDMRAANLVPEHNLWYKVYDFNDEEKTGKNWSILLEGEEEELCCPLGQAKNCCPRIGVDGAIIDGDGLPKAQNLEMKENSGIENIGASGVRDNDVNANLECVCESKEPAFDILCTWIYFFCDFTKSIVRDLRSKALAWFTKEKTA